MGHDQEKTTEVAFSAPKKPKRNKYTFACAMLASMNSVLAGYDVAVVSGAVIFLKDDLKINDTQIEILAGIINIYSLLGALAAGRTSDWIGRRYTMVFAATIFFVGALFMGLAPNYAVLMLGRFVAGVGVGYAAMIAPVYTAELAPASSRGFLSSFPEVFANFGILLGYVSNFAFAKLPEHLSWRMMFLAGAIPPVFLAVGTLAMPESPRWLVMQASDGCGIVGASSALPHMHLHHRFPRRHQIFSAARTRRVASSWSVPSTARTRRVAFSEPVDVYSLRTQSVSVISSQTFVGFCSSVARVIKVF